jgi:hypothetical protein
MDWLEQYSPMWVDWKRKKLRFAYQGQRITLTGVKDCTTKCLPLKPNKLRGLMRKGGIAQMVQLVVLAEDTQEEAIPEPLQQLIADHEHLFQEPTSLPPQLVMKTDGQNPVTARPFSHILSYMKTGR